jgi:PhoH-like ATPase
MKKNYILDTNVLLHDPTSLLAFEDNHVIVPVYVIEEIDNFKKQLDELGRNARAVSRDIDGYRTQGSLHDGVPLANGGSLRVLFATEAIPAELRSNHQKDDLILAVAASVRKAEPDLETVFVTMDTNLRIRADALGLVAQDYEKAHVRAKEFYLGFAELDSTAEVMNTLVNEGRMSLADVQGEGEGTGEKLSANEFLTFRDPGNPGIVVMGKVTPDGKDVVLVRNLRKPIWGIAARNREQVFALNLLLDPDIKLVTLSGKAGTGKTLLAVACGLHQVTDDPRYDRLLVSRPIFPLGKDIGFLPGTVEQKLNPWMQPIHDSIHFLMSNNRKDREKGTSGGSGTNSHMALMDMGVVQVEPLTYIRGRSIPNQFLIIDEAQNLTPHEVKTILTRAGEGTKIVLTGDPYQIDNPYLDSLSNGLSYTAGRFRGVDIAGTVTLERGERSQLAELAANLL